MFQGLSGVARPDATACFRDLRGGEHPTCARGTIAAGHTHRAASPGSRLPIRFLRRAIAKSKKKQTEQYLKGLRNLLDQYTLPTSDKVLAFMGSADVDFTQAPDGTTLLRMSGSDVVVPGDTLSIWVNASTHEMRKAQITTTYEGDEANATGTFKTLAASGLTFMSMAEVEVPARKMTLQVHNFDYEQND